MHIRTLAGWVSFGVQIATGAAMSAYPEYKDIALIIFWVATAVTAGSIVWWLAANFTIQLLIKRKTDVAPVAALKSAHPTDRDLLQERLVADLKKFAHPANNVNIVMANFVHRPLADWIDAAFGLAGWTRNYTQTPQERFNLQYWQGIDVTGVNKVLVDHIAEALKRAGVPVTKIEGGLKNVAKNLDPAKWERLEHRVNIRIGHH